MPIVFLSFQSFIMSDSQDSGGGQNHDKRFLTAPFNWDTSSNFTSTLDIDAIKVSSVCPDTDLVTPMVTSDTWDQGPPVLIPHNLATEDDRSLPRLEPMDQDQESSSDSESDDDCSASDSDSGSSSSSCSSPESASSSEAEVETSQVTKHSSIHSFSTK